MGSETWKIPVTEEPSLPWSDKPKTTPPRVFEGFFFLSPFLYLIPRKFASSKNILKPNRSFCKRCEQLKGVWHQNAISILLAPGGCPIVTEGLSRHEACIPPCTHLSDPILENSLPPLQPFLAPSALFDNCLVGDRRLCNGGGTKLDIGQQCSQTAPLF